MTAATVGAAASVNGVALHRAGEALDAATLRERACTELLRQAAQAAGLLDGGDCASGDGVVSQAASVAIERLLDRELSVPEAGETACRRHYAANAAKYVTGEEIQARHILFAVTPRTPLDAIRRQAERALDELRAHPGRFADLAAKLSNCPSGARGGDLGRLVRGQSAPEFEQALFGSAAVGVLPALVRTRYGLHIVAVDSRQAGCVVPFERARASIALQLETRAREGAFARYVCLLASGAQMSGVNF